MSGIALLTGDQRDALQEVTNIAMGRAGALLAEIMDGFVHLSVPAIFLADASNVSAIIAQSVGSGLIVTAVRQSFNGMLRGEAMAVYDERGCRNLADLMGYEDEVGAATDRELLLDVSNVLVGACLNGVADLLLSSLSWSAPTLIAENVKIDGLINPAQLTWDYAVVIQVRFTLESRDFTCHLLTLMSEESISQLKKGLDTFMESI